LASIKEKGRSREGRRGRGRGIAFPVLQVSADVQDPIVNRAETSTPTDTPSEFDTETIIEEREKSEMCYATVSKPYNESSE
jgi:hypothetical protein